VKQEPVPGVRDIRRWGIVLAGGDGVRLRRLTRFICGDDRPKQFCPLLSKDTLLCEAQQRAERSINPDQILYSVTRAHQQYYGHDLADRTSQRIVQPCNRGTAPAILYTLLHVFQRDPDAIAAVFPCDHYYSTEYVFTAALESAFRIAEVRPSSVVLLGAQPNAPEVEYGWIEVGETITGSHAGAFHVKRFQEKPPLSVAEHLFRTGSLWNTFVMVGHVGAFLELAFESVPGLMQVLRSALICSTSKAETKIDDWLYDRITPTDFSRQILSPGAARLVTVGLGDVVWNDLGDPDRVISTLQDRGFGLPAWARRWLTQNQLDRRQERRSMSAAVA
jgi:mannose-1-phosphate guanylyltransferase